MKDDMNLDGYGLKVWCCSSIQWRIVLRNGVSWLGIGISLMLCLRYVRRMLVGFVQIDVI